jgi:hypothetical protein
MSEPMNDKKHLVEDLPWLVNGTLSKTDHQKLTTAIDADEGLRAERDFFEKMRIAVLDEPTASPGDSGWNRLRERIEAEPVTRRPVANQAWWRPVAIAASVLLAVQALWVWGPLQSEGGYTPLGRAGVSVPADMVLLQVRPRADASLGDWQALLLRINAEVVSGPGAAGIYRVLVQRSQVDAALTLLKQADHLIVSAARE